jgi:uncharacterized membrane protein
MRIKNIIYILLALASFNSLASEMNLTCVGTEPFWQIDITSNKQMKLTIPGISNEIFSITQKTNAAGTSGDFAFALSGKNAQSDLIKLNIIKGECNDGMSDRIYPFNVLVEHQNTILYGCCK